MALSFRGITPSLTQQIAHATEKPEDLKIKGNAA